MECTAQDDQHGIDVVLWVANMHLEGWRRTPRVQDAPGYVLQMSAAWRPNEIAHGLRHAQRDAVPVLVGHGGHRCASCWDVHSTADGGAPLQAAWCVSTPTTKEIAPRGRCTTGCCTHRSSNYKTNARLSGNSVLAHSSRSLGTNCVDGPLCRASLIPRSSSA